jgi:hypothetical protein
MIGYVQVDDLAPPIIATFTRQVTAAGEAARYVVPKNIFHVFRGSEKAAGRAILRLCFFEEIHYNDGSDRLVHFLSTNA